MSQKYLTTTRFALSISGDEMSAFAADVVKFDHPTVTIKSVSMRTPKRDIPFPGSKIEYGDLDLTFIIDEAATNYRMLFDWLKQCLDNDNPPLYDVSLIIYGVNEIPVVKIVYKNCFIEGLNALGLNTQDTGDVVLTCAAKLKISEFTISAF